MQTIIDLANAVFKPVIDLGAAPIMLIVLTLRADLNCLGGWR